MSIVKSKGAKKNKGRKALHMHIERHDNGFSARTHFAQPAASSSARKAMGQDIYPPSHQVFGNQQDLANHVSDMFGGDDAPDGNEPAPTQKPMAE